MMQRKSAYFGESEQRFRWKTAHPFRSKRSPSPDSFHAVSSWQDRTATCPGWRLASATAAAPSASTVPREKLSGAGLAIGEVFAHPETVRAPFDVQGERRVVIEMTAGMVA